ncbi:hypothetical protein D3874_08330 [Oleomonas cavernae]|uniref:Peptidase M61 catalytic domain-containing protein n=1 Tax=Oleomonas cavernae TaxID=2320859 RepID=A0A418WAF7_9PROT|nr:hypothetical protein [Oleomonas cavernae]RJF87027.1 hypothetical protein D3874_08330 [Oleomonas cavernae]
MLERLAAVTALALIALTAPATATTAAAYRDPDVIYAALAVQAKETLSIGGGTIDVVFADGAEGLDRGPVMDWVKTSAVAVTTYFGRFPVAHVGILIVAEDDARVGQGGVTYGYNGAAIRVGVGRQAGLEAFRRDWVLVHEMTHLALPFLGDERRWAMEGSAVYVEPIARAQAGQLDPASVWRDSLTGMPKGQPDSTDQGLNHTDAWGRTYWGGATFYLLADIAIRERTGNRLGLQDALRAINRESGGNGTYWPMEKLVSVGDAATGTDVLATLYAQMKDSPVAPDLDTLFARLGVALKDNEVIFDDQAPLAAIRRKLTEPPAPVL